MDLEVLPPDLPDRSWTAAAWCAGEHVSAYDADNLPPATSGVDCATRDRIARKLCEPCPVRRQCAIDALHTDTRGVIRAGYAFPDLQVRAVRRRVMAEFGINSDPLVPVAGVCVNGHDLSTGDVYAWSRNRVRCGVCFREQAQRRDEVAA